MFKKVAVTALVSTALVLVNVQLVNGILFLVNEPSDVAVNTGVFALVLCVLVNYYPIQWLARYLTKESPHEECP
jgi:hypothetical protein